MTFVLWVIAAFVINSAMLVIGYGIGVISERAKWNALIEKGLLPTPERAAQLIDFGKRVLSRGQGHSQ